MSQPWTRCYPRCCLQLCFSSWGVKSTRRRCGVNGVRGGVHSHSRVASWCPVLCCVVLCCAVPQERKDLPRAVLKKIGKTEHEQVRHDHAATTTQHSAQQRVPSTHVRVLPWQNPSVRRLLVEALQVLASFR